MLGFEPVEPAFAEAGNQVPAHVYFVAGMCGQQCSVSVSQSRLFHKRSGQRWMEIAMSETQGTDDAATSEPKVGINPVPIFTGGDAGILSQPTDAAPDEES